MYIVDHEQQKYKEFPKMEIIMKINLAGRQESIGS